MTSRAASRRGDAGDSSLDTGLFLTGLSGCSGVCEGTSWCGDGQLAFGLEECDDGNNDDNDGCGNKCEIEDGWAWSSSS